MEKRKKRTRYARFGVFVLLLSMLVPLPAFAAGSANVVRTFVYENNLYTYVELNEIERPVTQVEAKIGGQSFSASGRLETVRQAGYPITYLLLVDNSNSMPPFRKQLLEFCQGLSEASGENTRFVLAAFGEEFQILDEGLTVETLEGPPGNPSIARYDSQTDDEGHHAAGDDGSETQSQQTQYDLCHPVSRPFLSCCSIIVVSTESS